MLSHPQIAEAGVIAVKDADENELPRAFISPKAEMMRKILTREISTEAFAQEVDVWVTERVRVRLCDVEAKSLLVSKLMECHFANQVSRHKQLRGGVVPVDAIPRRSVKERTYTISRIYLPVMSDHRVAHPERFYVDN